MDTTKKNLKPHNQAFPTLALAVASITATKEDFTQLTAMVHDAQYFATDQMGCISCHWQGRVAQVPGSLLLKQLTDDWITKGGALGRWRLRIRGDGTTLGSPEFVPFVIGAYAKLVKAAAKFAKWLEGTQGPLGIVYSSTEGVANDYVNMAMGTWKSGPPEQTLLHTLEIVGADERSVGLIVLPTHPLRVAWQQGFDMLVAYHRYEKNVPAANIKRYLAGVTGANFPAFLPGLKPDQVFVFADILWLHAVAMVDAADPEPRATVALLANVLKEAEGKISSIGGRGCGCVPHIFIGGRGGIPHISTDHYAARVLSKGLQRYYQWYPAYNKLYIHGLSTGDGAFLVRALGKTLRTQNIDVGTPHDPIIDVGTPHDPIHDHLISNDSNLLRFDLNLFPARNNDNVVTGQFLTSIAEHRRANDLIVAADADLWVLDNAEYPGGVILPRLRWTIHNQTMPTSYAHVAIVFGNAHSHVECRSDVPSKGTLETHGLLIVPEQKFSLTPYPHWLNYIPANPQGVVHPESSFITKYLIALHNHILRATVRHLGGNDEQWPVLITTLNLPLTQMMGGAAGISPAGKIEETELSAAEKLHQLHKLCDLVITIGGNLGIEYFDSPRDLPSIYHTHVVDCVPERNNLGFLQLISSTTHFEDITQILMNELQTMGLSADMQEARQLVEQLRAISGRLVMHLRNPQDSAKLMALAWARAHCIKAAADDLPLWPSLYFGFWLPMDDIVKPIRGGAVTDALGVATDDKFIVRPSISLLYVCLTAERKLNFSVITVVFCRNLIAAQGVNLVNNVKEQIGTYIAGWEKLFAAEIPTLAAVRNRSWLARILRFYVNKAHRHNLSSQYYDLLTDAIEHIAIEPDYNLSEQLDGSSRIYVFCPEYVAAQPTQLSTSDAQLIWLFGTGNVFNPSDGQTTTITADKPDKPYETNSVIDNTNSLDSLGSSVLPNASPVLLSIGDHLESATPKNTFSVELVTDSAAADTVPIDHA